MEDESPDEPGLREPTTDDLIRWAQRFDFPDEPPRRERVSAKRPERV